MNISSRQNQLFKAINKLLNGRHDVADNSLFRATDTCNLIVLEGAHLCKEWLLKCGLPLIAVFTNDHTANYELNDIKSAIPANIIRTMPYGLLKSLSNISASQGVLFVVAKKKVKTPEIINDNSIMLDQIQDPGNVGTIIRTAAAAGIKQVFLSEGCAKAWSPKVLRSAQGAHFIIDIFEQCELANLIASADANVYVTSLSEDSVSLYKLQIQQPSIWVFGNEGSGVSSKIKSEISNGVYIPLENNVESLNVASAVSICLFEQKRQAMNAV